MYVLFFTSMEISSEQHKEKYRGREKSIIWLAHFGINSLAEKGDCLENIYYIVILNM